MTLLAVPAAGAAWLGASMLVLSEGRRAFAAGLLLFAAGLALALVRYQPLAAGVIAGGGLIAAGLRARDGRPGWATLPAGSTPRLLLSLVVGVVGAFAAGSLMPGPGPAPARAAVVLGGVMAAARLLSTTHRDAALAAAAALALAMAGVDALVAGDTALTVAGAGAVAAILISLIPAAEEANG